MVHEAAYDSKHGKSLKILTLKQMLQGLPIALAQVKPVNTSENLQTKWNQTNHIFFVSRKRND